MFQESGKMAFDLQTGENHSIVVYLYGDKAVRIIKDFSIISRSSYWSSSSVRISKISVELVILVLKGLSLSESSIRLALRQI